MLQGFIVEGKTLGTEKTDWKTSELNGNDAFVFGDQIVNGYADIHTIKNIYKLGGITDRDFKYVRDQIKKLVINSGQSLILGTENDPSTLSPNEGDAYLIETGVGDWVGKDSQIARWLSGAWIYYTGEPGGASNVEELGVSTLTDADEISMCAGYLIGTITQQLSAFDFDFKKKEKAQLHYKESVQKCRELRYKFAENNMLQMIPQYAGLALADVLSGLYHILYRNQGVDGIYYGDLMPGLGDWVKGVATWDGVHDPTKTGLALKPWTTLQGQNMTDYAAFLEDKLFVGGLIEGQDN